MSSIRRSRRDATITAAIALGTTLLGCGNTVRLVDGSGGDGASESASTSSTAGGVAGQGGFGSTGEGGSATAGQGGSSGGACAECPGSDCPGSVLWSRQFGGEIGLNTVDMAIDTSENILLLAVGERGADLGGGPIAVGSPNDLSPELYLAKYDPSGRHLWSRSIDPVPFGSPEHHMAVDPSGNVVVSGHYQLPDAPFDTGLVFVKLDPSGNDLWTRLVPGSGEIGAVAIGTDGALVVGGSTGSTIDFGGGVIGTHATTGTFIAKLDSAGDHVWSRLLSVALGNVNGLALGPNDDILLTGPARADELYPEESDWNANTPIAYVAKLDGAGTEVWFRSAGRTKLGSGGWSVASDTAGNVYVTGSSESLASFFGGGPLESDHAEACLVGACPLFVAKLTGSGTPVWSKSFGFSPLHPRIAVDTQGAVVVASALGGTGEIGGCAFTVPYWTELGVMKLDAAGNHVWSERSNSAPSDFTSPESIATTSDGSVVLAGRFDGVMDLGAGPMTSQGGESFLLKLSP
jgi:hypothetical protein